MTWSDRYAALFGLALVAAVLGNPVVATVQGLAAGVDAGRMGAGLGLLLAAYAGYLALARFLGPLVLPAADAAWLVLSPLPRRSVLGRAASVLLAVAAAAGAVLGLAVPAVLGVPDDLAVRLTAALVLGLGAAVGGMATAVLAQASQTWDSWLLTMIAGAVLLAAAAALLGGGPGRQVLLAVAGAPVAAVVAAAGLAAAVTAGLLRRAWIALDRIPAAKILSASARGGRVLSAAVTMDTGALTWVAEDNHWRGRVLRSRPWPGSAPRSAWAAGLAPAWPEWRRAGRRPGRLALLLGSTALPAVAAQAAGGMSALPVGVLLCGALTAAVAFTTGARRDGDNPSLARLLAVGPRALMAARAVLPALAAALWSSLALAGLAAAGALPGGPWWLLGPATAPAMAAGALRMARRRPADHSMPVIETAGAALPMGPIIWALTGADLALLGCLPALVALTGPSASLTASVITQVLAGAGVLTAYLLRQGRGAGEG
ncbi:DUF6297 family protein [Sphaerisporangium sp. TRM90804]|uniref:DUF6297 family protein n=1 Tax=Sphaerisporangium sp. TRM90804 TaxID=3031113 RepID=UPI00244A187A|nr:DUF6297 family protein [Sphaerisporangium sp. TRM90804]MDH2424347.1 DUF6297 family protein [Sphaerisporangium sp. TRM90804]